MSETTRRRFGRGERADTARCLHPARTAIAWLILASVGTVAGCSATGPDGAGLPKIESSSVNAPPPAVSVDGKPPHENQTSAAQTTPAAPPGGHAGAHVAGTGTAIIGFRKSTVVLYEGETSNNGRRVPSGSFSTPIRVQEQTSGKRIPIATVDGVRWIAREDVTLN